METKDAIKQTYELSHMVLGGYLEDLSDEELMNRPGEGCNHIAWQLGHLIGSECNLLNLVAPGAAVELPEGFVENHSKENCDCDDGSRFCSKAEYMDLWGKVKAATFAALDSMSEEDLDRQGPEPMRGVCPTVGSLFLLIGTHPMMHAGQIVPIRRRLQKPIVM